MEIKSIHHNPGGALAGILLFFLLAFGATITMDFPTPTVPAPTGIATDTPPSLKLTLTSIPYNESNLHPPATITAQIPQLLGSDDPRVRAFNQAIGDLVEAEVESFKLGLTGLSDPPEFAVSTFDAKYNVVYQGGDLWSIKFDMTVYVDAAAHPGDISRTLNFDFASSKNISMDDLFLADSNYLELISRYCSDQLAARDIGFDSTTVGAEPTPENYRNWNITSDGLMITFDRGQVAAYAAPAQIVTIPYGELAAILNPQGPLAGFGQ